MSFPRPEAGSRFDGPELLWLLREMRREIRRGDPLPSLEELRARIASRRSLRHLVETDRRFLTMGQTAFIFCRSKAYVRKMIENGRLSGEYVSAEASPSGRPHWRIPVDEVRELAEAEGE